MVNLVPRSVSRADPDVKRWHFHSLTEVDTWIEA
jgi:hypothetical protein